MPEPSVISVAQVAESLKLSDRQVRRLIAAKLLPAHEVGSGFVIRRANVAKVPKERKPGPKPMGK